MDRRSFMFSLSAAGALASSGVTLAKSTATYDPTERSIAELAAALAAGTTSSVALVEAYRARIARHDTGPSGLHAVLALNPDALAAAADLDRERAAGHVRGPLHGIPILIKDNVEGVEPK